LADESRQNDRRKMEHIDITLNNPEVDRKAAFFDAIQLNHRALPQLDFNEVDPKTEFLDHQLSFPLLISAMTGGSDPKLAHINRNLASAAQHCGVAMSVGSQRVSFDNAQARKSFQLRQYAPDALLFANLGAVQLNYGFGLKQCKQVVDLLEANALVFHLNPLQELIQKEGNCNFANLIEKISAVQDKLSVPVILKEVGAGFSVADGELAEKYGINMIDIAGRGGTSWSLVEGARSSGDKRTAALGEAFKDWGTPTPGALIKLRKNNPNLTFIASGGIRNGIDMVKACVLGARLSGVGLPFLKAALSDVDDVCFMIEQFKAEFVAASFLTGCSKVEQLFANQGLLLDG